MADNDLIKRVRSEHPFPWTRVMGNRGLIRLIDANNNEVSLLGMTELVCYLTTVMAQKKAEA